MTGAVTKIENKFIIVIHEGDIERLKHKHYLETHLGEIVMYNKHDIYHGIKHTNYKEN